MNKLHWITVAGAGSLNGDGERRTGADDKGCTRADDESDSLGSQGNVLDAELLRDLVLESYCLVVAKMPKKDRPVDPTTFGGRGDERYPPTHQ